MPYRTSLRRPRHTVAPADPRPARLGGAAGPNFTRSPHSPAAPLLPAHTARRGRALLTAGAEG